MIRVVILGAGNVATHLSNAFLNTNKVDIIQLYSRKKSSLKHIDNQINTTTNLNDLKTADVYIIAITDDEIALFSSKLPLKNSLVVHTSGSLAMNKLHDKFRKGVFYPLQTFSKNKKIDFKSIPICIEAKNNDDLILLEKLASIISKNVYQINSKQRESLHVAAVFVNNFVNHLYHIGNKICMNHNVPFEILEPLIQETASKVLYLPPYEAQTGPAKRKDEKTIKNHLLLLTNNQQKIYTILTQSISTTYGEKL